MAQTLSAARMRASTLRGQVRSRAGAVRARARAAASAPASQAELVASRDRNAMLEQEVTRLAAELDEASSLKVLDFYCSDEPSAQAAVDIFVGEWASAFPAPFESLRAGTAPLFEIEHVPWGVKALGGVEGERVVELGPLEGGHTYLLDRLGAAEIVAIEANTRAYLKCLIAKELLGIPNGHFLCGDAIAYLEQHVESNAPKFDLCLASGILYHLVNPIRGLELMTRSSDRLLLWTMYYDGEYINSREDLRVKFPVAKPENYQGFEHTLHRQEYQQSLNDKGFCGGSAADSAWLSRADIFRAIEHFGFEVVDVGFEEQNHKGNGPCICVAAKRIGT
jgi:hypothetical protein